MLQVFIRGKHWMVSNENEYGPRAGSRSILADIKIQKCRI